jgi:hypothetical protein
MDALSPLLAGLALGLASLAVLTFLPGQSTATSALAKKSDDTAEGSSDGTDSDDSEGSESEADAPATTQQLAPPLAEPSPDKGTLRQRRPGAASTSSTQAVAKPQAEQAAHRGAQALAGVQAELQEAIFGSSDPAVMQSAMRKAQRRVIIKS